jgi:hypothetical protein
MAEDWANTVATTSFEKAVEFQMMELHEDFESMSDFKGGVTGEKVEITDRFSKLRAKRVKERLGRTELQETAVERRWIHKQDRLAVHTALDADDQMATEIPLDSPLAAAVAYGIQTGRQDEFLIGFHGNAYVGKDGTTAVPFKAANVLAADYGGTGGVYTGLNLNKLRGLRKLARKRLINPKKPGNKLHMLISAEEIEDLLSIDQYISRDYNPDSQSNYKPMSSDAKQALQDGEPTDFLGIHFVPAEFTNSEAFPESAALGVNGSGHRRCPVWIPSGMAGRQWLLVESHRDQRADLNHAWQFSAYTNVRYARVHEDKCFIVECGDA